MSIVIYKQPRLLDFAGNNLFLQLKGTDYAIQKGVNAFLYFSDSANFVDEDVLTLTFMGRDHVFLLKEALVPFPTEYVVPAGYDDVLFFALQNQLTHLYNGLVNYAPLAQYYNLVTDNHAIFITAKNFGSAYNIGTALTGNIVNVDAHGGGVDEIIRDNYYFAVTLFVENLSTRGTYFSLPEFRLDPNLSQLATIDMAKVVRRRFFDFFDLPDFAANAPAKTAYTYINFYFTVKEMTGSTILATATTQTYKALNGMVNKSEHAAFDIRQWVVDQKRFITNMPADVVTYAGAKALLYYLNPYAGSSSVVIKMLIAHTAGDDIAYSAQMDGLAQYDTVMIPVDAIVATLVADGSLVRMVEVWVETTTGVLVAGKQTYYYTPKPLHGRSLLYQNRYGVMDAVNTYQQSSDLKTEAEQSTHAVTPGYSRYVGDIAAVHPSVTDTVTTETGPISHAMAANLKELAASRVVFLATADRYIRVVIEPGSFSIADEAKETCNVKFKFKAAFDGDFISTPIALPTAPHEDYSYEYIDSDYQ
jgi:hypothetical protein